MPLLAAIFRFGIFRGRNTAQLNRQGNLFVKLVRLLQAQHQPKNQYKTESQRRQAIEKLKEQLNSQKQQ
jgi:hypothetical protein